MSKRIIKRSIGVLVLAGMVGGAIAYGLIQRETLIVGGVIFVVSFTSLTMFVFWLFESSSPGA